MLTLIFESPDAAELDSPDNLTVSPQGALLLCEDGGGDQFLRGVTLDGRIFDFAENLQNDYEWAGATLRRRRSILERSQGSRRQQASGQPLGSRHAVREPAGRDERSAIRRRPVTKA